MNEKYLRSAKPRLIMCVENGIAANGPWVTQLEYFIRDVDLGWDELIDEGFDPNSKTGLGAVYYRIVRRGGEEFYLSTVAASRDHVLKAWGSAGLAYCDPITGLAVVRVETRIPPDAQAMIESYRQKLPDQV